MRVLFVCSSGMSSAIAVNALQKEGAKNGIDIEGYVKVIREVSKEEEIFLIDHYEYWDRLSKVQKELIESWLVEGRANHRGHLEIAKKIFKDLRIYDSSTSQT